MCIKLENTGKIIIPGSRATVISIRGSKEMVWGADLGHGWMANARIESILKGVWQNYGFIYPGIIEVTSFFEKNHVFRFTGIKKIGIIHNDANFLVATEPASDIVKKVHGRQPLYEHLELLTSTIYLKQSA